MATKLESIARREGIEFKLDGNWRFRDSFRWTCCCGEASAAVVRLAAGPGGTLAKRCPRLHSLSPGEGTDFFVLLPALRAIAADGEGRTTGQGKL